MTVANISNNDNCGSAFDYGNNGKYQLLTIVFCVHEHNGVSWYVVYIYVVWNTCSIYLYISNISTEKRNITDYYICILFLLVDIQKRQYSIR